MSAILKLRADSSNTNPLGNKAGMSLVIGLFPWCLPGSVVGREGQRELLQSQDWLLRRRWLSLVPHGANTTSLSLGRKTVDHPLSCSFLCEERGAGTYESMGPISCV